MVLHLLPHPLDLAAQSLILLLQPPQDAIARVLIDARLVANLAQERGEVQRRTGGREERVLGSHAREEEGARVASEGALQEKGQLRRAVRDVRKDELAAGTRGCSPAAVASTTDGVIIWTEKMLSLPPHRALPRPS